MISPAEFLPLYSGFDSPLSPLDCGQKCAPYNRGVPFCCDTRHAVPTAYQAEWLYLQDHTRLWHRWAAPDPAETARLEQEAGPDLVLIECLGHQHCERDFRSIVCRAFPFFPYLDSRGDFLGLSFYWEYADRCWVISNLGIVTPEYRAEFIRTYTRIFEHMPAERENFFQHSAEMRRVFAQVRRTIPLLHRDGQSYKLSPKTERLRLVPPTHFPKYGPYQISDALLFPDELP